MNKLCIPKVEHFDAGSVEAKKIRLLIVSEGFEKRSLTFLSECKCSFQKIVICKYAPPKDSKFDILYKSASEKCSPNEIYQESYNRFEPFDFECNMENQLATMHSFEEIVVDISVMSKYMIMQIIGLLKSFQGDLRIIYTEPMSYAPQCEVTEKGQHVTEEQSYAAQLPSSGVQNIVRTPLLSSIIMQRSPTLLVSFLSFNEQLIRALLSEYNPARLLLINGIPTHCSWREKSTNNIHKSVIKEYHQDNPLDENGLLARKSNTLHYHETLDLLAEIYKEYCEDYRIVLSPTGSKMQALACALIKNCCEDIHIEYPTPESYYVDGYTSAEIREVHQVLFRSFNNFLISLADDLDLNG